MTLREHHEEAKELAASYNNNKQNGGNKMTHDELIEILQAHKAGKKIEILSGYGKWKEAFKDGVITQSKFRIAPEASTVAWAIEDFAAHSECWYKYKNSGGVFDSSVAKIQAFGGDFAMFLLRDNWYYPNEKGVEWFYCETPNGKFKPCVKEVIG